MSAPNRKKDDICHLYKIPNTLNRVERLFFVIDFIAALISLHNNHLVRSFAVSIQIMSAFLYFILNVVDDGHFWYKAEKARRRNGIENGLGVRFSELETDGYYNNDCATSIEKYALNLLESNLYSKEISGKMIVFGIIKSGIAVIVLLLAYRFVDDYELLLIIAQTVFSAYIFVDTVMLLLYKARMENLFDEGYLALITPGVNNKSKEAVFLAYTVEYEAIKAHYKIRLDERIFNKNKEEYDKQWKQILSHKKAD